MAVEIRLPTVLRQYAGGQASIRANGGTIGEVFEDAQRQFPLLAGHLVTEEGKLHRFVNVYLNDEDVRFLQGLDTPVNDSDTVVILPAMAGGSL